MKFNVTKSDYISFVCVFTGYIFRLIFICIYPIQPRDSYTYLTEIIRWERFGVLPNNKNQFGLWILKIPYHFWGFDIFNGGIIINLLFGLMIILLLIKLTYLLFNRHSISLLVGLIVSSHPSFIRFSCTFLRENSFLLFTCFFLYFTALCICHNSIIFTICTGCSIGSAFLCRLEGAELIVLYFLIKTFFSPPAQKKMLFIDFTVLIISFFLFICFITFILKLDKVGLPYLFSKMSI